jgi:hypothetical protein
VNGVNLNRNTIMSKQHKELTGKTLGKLKVLGKVDLTGQTFGQLTVLGPDTPSSDKEAKHDDKRK